MRLPLPIMFFLLMSLVFFAVFDILSDSKKVHELANRRMAKVILDSTLKDVRMNLNGYAARLASNGGELNVDLDELFQRSTSGESAALSEQALVLYLNEEGRILKGSLGSELLSPYALRRLSAEAQAPRTLFPETDESATEFRVITANSVDYVISESNDLTGGHAPGEPSKVMIGLPVEQVLLKRLRHYEIFSGRSLSQYSESGNLDGTPSISRLVAELQNEEYKAFHFDAIAQIVIVLVAFVVCVMIGQHIDEKNLALEESHEEISSREKEAQRLRKLAEKASDAKSRFIANMSHELRTPLNAVLGYSELIMNESCGKLDGAQQKYKTHAENIHAGGSRLLNQISQVLDLSAWDLGEIELTKQNVAMDQILTEVFGKYADRIAARGLKLETDIAPDLPQILADRGKIADLFRHLVSNAVKFSDTGGTVRVSARVNEDNALEVRVQDTGPGIHPDLIEAIGQPFVQGQDVYARSHQGLGLGLTLARAYADSHGAKLSIESGQGIGTQVTVSFPPALADEPVTRQERNSHSLGYGDTSPALSP